jgi:hypothetical protein
MPWISLSIFYRDEVVLARNAEAGTCTLPITPRLSTDSIYMENHGRHHVDQTAWSETRAVDHRA